MMMKEMLCVVIPSRAGNSSEVIKLIKPLKEIVSEVIKPALTFCLSKLSLQTIKRFVLQAVSKPQIIRYKNKKI